MAIESLEDLKRTERNLGIFALAFGLALAFAIDAIFLGSTFQEPELNRLKENGVVTKCTRKLGTQYVRCEIGEPIFATISLPSYLLSHGWEKYSPSKTGDNTPGAQLYKKGHYRLEVSSDKFIHYKA